MNIEEKDIKELTYLIEQFTVLSNELREINQKFTKIEKRIANYFPQYKELKKPPAKIINIDLNRENLMKIFEELLQITKEKGDVEFSIKIKEYSAEIIVALALELGVPGSKKMGTKKAINGIKGRIQESLMLS